MKLLWDDPLRRLMKLSWLLLGVKWILFRSEWGRRNLSQALALFLGKMGMKALRLIFSFKSCSSHWIHVPLYFPSAIYPLGTQIWQLEKDIAVRNQKLAVIVLFQNSGDDSSSWGDDSQTWETTRLRAETTLHSKLQTSNFCDALRETTRQYWRRLPNLGDDSHWGGVGSGTSHSDYLYCLALRETTREFPESTRQCITRHIVL